MAKIIENMAGRRMIRLSPDDIIMVVSLYQQVLKGMTPDNYLDLSSYLGTQTFYLPEEV